ncbi:collagen alpha-1(I) chain-like [Panthera pardus]|uniref:Collagen alpha-1(I) chain-like n=1 Tax=Panthera pardus TaxID=9691 RepID=A0A9W2UYV1_PANPR|nr:collagen alpha-1(I) chain-like [Panthera pardus]
MIYFSGLQLTSPSSSISQDLKNKDDGSSRQLTRPTADRGPPPPRCDSQTRRNPSGSRRLEPSLGGRQRWLAGVCRRAGGVWAPAPGAPAPRGCPGGGGCFAWPTAGLGGEVCAAAGGTRKQLRFRDIISERQKRSRSPADGRRPSSTAGRPDPGARRRPLCPSLLPPALPRSAHAGAAPPPPPGARRGLPPAPRQRRAGWPEVAGREGARGEPGSPHPPAGAAPCRLRRKVKQTRTGESGARGSAQGWPAPGSAPRTPGASRTAREDDPALPARRRAPRPPPPAGRSQAPPRPAPAGPGLSAAAGGRGAGRRPPDSPLASPGRAGAALGRPRSPSDRSASLCCRAELFPGGGFLASSSLDPPPPTPPPSPPLPRGGSEAEYFLS